jgi:hypothetical protein
MAKDFGKQKVSDLNHREHRASTEKNLLSVLLSDLCGKL